MNQTPPISRLWCLLLPLFLTGCGGESGGGEQNPPVEATIAAEHIAQNDLGVAQMGQYAYATAHDTFATLIAQTPDWHEARVNHAIATLNRQEEGDERVALELVAAILQEDPTQTRANYVAGIVHLYVGEPELAVTFFRAVVDADPGDAYANYWLGQALTQTGDFASASRYFDATIAVDPYLRSAYWAGAQAARRTANDEHAKSLLAGYQRFATNPAARVAGFSYRKMGPKADARAVNPTARTPLARPAGELFAAAQTFATGPWSTASLTTADINGDGNADLAAVVDDAGSDSNDLLIWLGDGTGGFTPLAVSASFAGATRALIWGDIDDDGRIDLVRCGDAGVAIYRTTDWSQMHTLSNAPCAGGATIDADHDGDLDVFVTGPDGSILHSNNRDGSFRELGQEFGITTPAGRQIVVADLDLDRDLDIIVLGDSGTALQNDRTWQYSPYPGLSIPDSLVAATAGDTDADGLMEVFGISAQGQLIRFRDDGTTWTRSVMASDLGAAPEVEISLVDFDGDGTRTLLLSGDGAIRLLDPGTGKVTFTHALAGITSAVAVSVDPARGPSLIAAHPQRLDHLAPGTGRHGFLTIAASGKSEADQMRSNASGIGTYLKLRVAGQWRVAAALDTHSGPGQSHGPVSFGLAGHPAADFLALAWSDGVSQTEIDLAGGRRHNIEETQRQLSSCPVVFVWDGSRYQFVTDVLGVGGLGFFAGPGETVPPRPIERYLLEDHVLAARSGQYHIKLTEPMEESAYLDQARILIYDLPPEWSLVLDERMEGNGPRVTSSPIAYRRVASPIRATAATGHDITRDLRFRDRTAPDPGPLDHRFVGLLERNQVVTLKFDQAIDQPGATLVADAWVEYPYSQTVFAAWQAGINFEMPTLEARGTDGIWHTVVREFGYPAGMPRKMALPMPALPRGTDALRITSNMEIYWDTLRVAFAEDRDLNPHVLTPTTATVARTGFPQRTNGPQRQPAYTYSTRSPYWDTKVQQGFYTRLGDATPLVTDADGAVAIIGGGEEIDLAFQVPPPVAPGLRRHVVLEFRGWAKDMDLYTDHGETVGPLPLPDGLDATRLARREALHNRYNVRFLEGL